jgi:hypothetical protein
MRRVISQRQFSPGIETLLGSHRAAIRSYERNWLLLGLGGGPCIAREAQQWMEGRRHRTEPVSDEIPRPRRTGLVRDNQTALNCGTVRHGERSRAVTHNYWEEK